MSSLGLISPEVFRHTQETESQQIKMGRLTDRYSRWLTKCTPTIRGCKPCLTKHVECCICTTSFNPARLLAFASSSKNENKEHHHLKPSCFWPLPLPFPLRPRSFQQECYKLHHCVNPSCICWNPNPPWDDIRMWGLWEVIGLWEWSPGDEMSALIRKRP